MKARAETRRKPKMGRPRSFQETEALDAAMRVFWEKGYEGASLDDLTTAMGINRSSLYATFGDKASLFQSVIAHYAEGPVAYMQEALKKPTAREVVETLFRETVKVLADTTHPRGCLLIQGGMACGAGAEQVQGSLTKWRNRGLQQLQKRFKRARTEGDLPQDVNPNDLARYVSVVLNGLGIQAVNGATAAELERAAELALRSMPQ
jgi:AcrR family transcriptional regulator